MEPLVGQWKPKKLLFCGSKELEPSSLSADDNPHAENEGGVNLQGASSAAALPANSPPWQKDAELELPRQTRQMLSDGLPCVQRLPQLPLLLLHFVL